MSVHREWKVQEVAQVEDPMIKNCQDLRPRSILEYEVIVGYHNIAPPKYPMMEIDHDPTISIHFGV